MKTNLDKWNYLIDELNKKSKEFIESQNIGFNISDNFYKVDSFGDISEITILGIRYIHRNNAVIYRGYKPTRKDIDDLTSYIYSSIFFDIKNVLVYCSMRDDDNFNVYINDFAIGKHYFKSKSDAERESAKIKRIEEEKNIFYEANKKSTNYNYDANGYTFLGWQNNWKEDPELLKECRAKHHRHIEVKVGHKGMDNTVSCPLCKIYWKYDCSD